MVAQSTYPRAFSSSISSLDNSTLPASSRRPSCPFRHRLDQTPGTPRPCRDDRLPRCSSRRVGQQVVELDRARLDELPLLRAQSIAPGAELGEDHLAVRRSAALREQVLPLHAVGDRYTGVGQHRRRDIDRADDVLSHRGRRASRVTAHDQWNTNELVVEQAAMQHTAVIAELLAMVGGDHHQVVVGRRSLAPRAAGLNISLRVSSVSRMPPS